MMTSQIWKSARFTKTQKSRHLENETSFLQKKKNYYSHIKHCFMTKNSFVAEVIFKFKGMLNRAFTALSA